MREVRRDPLTGRWVLLSTDRVPATLLPGEVPGGDVAPADCPFCPGNEAHTERTLAAVERDGRWVARAFPNRRPALVIEEELRHRGEGPYDRVSGTGAHEVIVECPEHAVPLWELPPAQIAAAMRLARERLLDLQRDTRFRSLWWFRNHGRSAGASVHHPHAQIVAMPVVPSALAAMASRSRRWRRDRGRDLLQDIVDHDREDGSRVVWEGDRVVAVCPWAPMSPFEVWLIPSSPGATFAQADDRLIDELAAGMRAVLGQLARVLGREQNGRSVTPATNAMLYNAPAGVPSPGFRWHLRIQPRLVAQGALEQATGDAVHWVFPEEAAAALRG